MALLPSIITKLSTVFQRARIKSPTKKQWNHNKIWTVFEQLPTEILLLIYNRLERPTQVLLSITCKRFRCIFWSRLASRSYTTEEKIEISQYLELDWPKYLTCRLCGALFEWKRRENSNYGCPASDKHKYLSCRRIGPINIPYKTRNVVSINVEVVDLISRYHDRGRFAGLPASCLNHKHTSPHRRNLSWETRARWVNGQLVVRIQWMFHLDAPPAIAFEQKEGEMMICNHTWMHQPESWKPRTKLDIINIPREIVATKCAYCACDVNISRQILRNNCVKMVVSAWYNFGGSSSRDLSHTQIFSVSPLQRIDQASLSRRNLRELFDSGSDEEDKS